MPHVERHLWRKKVNLPGYTHLARLTPLQEGYQAFDLDNYICEPHCTPDSVGDAAPVKQHQSLYQQCSAVHCSAVQNVVQTQTAVCSAAGCSISLRRSAIVNSRKAAGGRGN